LTQPFSRCYKQLPCARGVQPVNAGRLPAV
jgi:hypothetical protein